MLKSMEFSVFMLFAVSLHHSVAAQPSGLQHHQRLERCLNPRMDESALRQPSFLFCKLTNQYKMILVCVQDLEADFEMS